MNNSNPFNWIGSPSAQTFAPNTIDGNGNNRRSHDSIDLNRTGDRMMELTEREQAILVGATRLH
ncbi:hypothetical protein [Coleofasciculus chthonoplastes]|uniref:hypothetical protein n=1 Tax=Coleofasciculus chthonoplastes TaxID=64178 RepID=UPI0032F51693